MLVRNGLLCKSCGSTCRERFDDDDVQIACPTCDETGVDAHGNRCQFCEYGMFRVAGCPKATVGSELSEAINLCGFAEKGLLPDAGGMLDQSARWLAVYYRYSYEQARVDAERGNNGSRN